ncbi:MAG: hypothetical protein FJ135_02750 [Deltaproteobacteria bacterium]|nr:hypothetical protein [Deltaproteobacteria bacterium]
MLMLFFWRQIQRLWQRSKATPQAPNHLGGRGVPNILGICESCGAIVVEGLHKVTPTGHLCQRCAGSHQHKDVE